MKSSTWIKLAAILLLGLLLRVYMIAGPMNAIEADQATVGLMARRILQGEFPLFYWGLPYQGPLDAYLTAPLIWLFGSSREILRVAPVIFSLLFVLATFGLGKAVYSEQIGLAAALYAALSPFMLTFRGLMADADYIMVLLCSSLSLWLFHSWRLSPRPRKLIALAAILALGFWLHPVMAYTAGAIGLVWLTGRLWVGRGENAAGTAAKLSAGLALPAGGAVTILQWLGTVTLPVIFGLLIPPPYSGVDLERQFRLVDSPWGDAAFLLALLALAALLFFAAVEIRQGRPLLAVFFMFSLYMFVSLAVVLQIKVDALSLPRYLTPIYAGIPLWIAGLYRLAGRRRQPGHLLLGALIAVNLWGNLTMKPIHAPYALLEWLQARPGVEYVYSDYWTGYWLAFESDESVIPYAIDGNNQPAFNRYPAYQRRVEEAQNPLFIYQAGQENERSFRQQLLNKNVGFQVVSIEEYIVYYDLDRRIRLPFKE